MNINQGDGSLISYIEDTVIFVNDTVEVGTGIPLTPTQQTEQQDAIDFLADQLITRTGITLAHHKKIYSANDFSNLRKKCYIHKVNGQAGNAKIGDTPNTFYRSSAHTRPTEGYNLIVSEGGEGQLGLADLESGGNGNCFTWNISGLVNDLSWEGDVAKNTSYLFPPAFFKKE